MLLRDLWPGVHAGRADAVAPTYCHELPSCAVHEMPQVVDSLLRQQLRCRGALTCAVRLAWGMGCPCLESSKAQEFEWCCGSCVPPVCPS